MKSSVPLYKQLINWYGKNKRTLPWRNTKDPYKIWISEIMLQQTTVNAVIPYYVKWIKFFPTVKTVARTPIQKVLRAWQGLGYYQRAKNLHKSSKMIVDKHQGRIPKDPEQLKLLPGFGPYTIGAILSIAYDLRYPIIDANVRRVVMRLLAIDDFMSSSHDHLIYQYLEKILPQKNTGDFNQALMELGALICRNQEPLCLSCPVKMHCKAYKKGIQEIIPRKKTVKIKKLDVVIGVFKRKNKYFIQKRASKGLFADLWEFPGGKVKRGESIKRALKRELNEELGIEIITSHHFMNTYHYFTQYKANLHVSFCTPNQYPQTNHIRKWVSLKELDRFPMPSGSAKIVDRLRQSV